MGDFVCFIYAQLNICFVYKLYVLTFSFINASNFTGINCPDYCEFKIHKGSISHLCSPDCNVQTKRKGTDSQNNDSKRKDVTVVIRQTD